MNIRISFCDARLSLAAVHTTPSWLARWLLGRDEQDRLAICLRDSLWIWDCTGRRITDQAVIAALDRERERERSSQTA